MPHQMICTEEGIQLMMRTAQPTRITTKAHKIARVGCISESSMPREMILTEGIQLMMITGQSSGITPKADETVSTHSLTFDVGCISELGTSRQMILPEVYLTNDDNRPVLMDHHEGR